MIRMLFALFILTCTGCDSQTDSRLPIQGQKKNNQLDHADFHRHEKHPIPMTNSQNESSPSPDLNHQKTLTSEDRESEVPSEPAPWETPAGFALFILQNAPQSSTTDLTMFQLKWRLLEQSYEENGIAELIRISESLHNPHHNIQFLTRFISFLFEIGKKQDALNLIEYCIKFSESINQHNVRASALYTLSLSLRELGHNQNALSVLELAVESAKQIEDQHLYRSISQALAYQGKYKTALELAEEINEETLRFQSINNVATSWSRTATREQIIELAPEFIRSASAIPKGSSRSSVLEIVASALGKADEIDRALKIINQLDSDLSYKDYRINEIVSLLITADQIDRALGIYMRYKNSMKYRSSFTEHLCEALAGAGKYEMAMDYASTIENSEIKAKTLENIAKTLADHGQFNKAVEIALTIQSVYHEQTGALTQIVSDLVKIGDYRFATQVAQHVKWYDGILAFREIASAQVKAGGLKEAVETAESIEEDLDQALFLTEIAVVALEIGEKEAALDLLKKSLDPTEGIEYLYTKTTVLVRIASTLGSAGEVVEAMRVMTLATDVANSIQSVETRRAALSAIPVPLVGLGEWKQAVRVISMIDNVYTKNSLMNAIVKKLIEQNDIESAIEVARISGSNHRLATICRACIEAHNLGEAAHIAEMIKDANTKDVALIELVRASATLDRIDEALDHYLEIKDQAHQVTALKHILEHIVERLCQDNPAEYSPDALERVVAASQSIGDHSMKASLLIESAFALGRLGKNQRALELLDLVLEMTPEIQPTGGHFLSAVRNKTTYQHEILSLVLELGDTQRATKVIDMMEGVRTQSHALEYVAINYAALTDYQNAMQTVERIEESQIKKSAIINIGLMIVQKGDDTRGKSKRTPTWKQGLISGFGVNAEEPRLKKSFTTAETIVAKRIVETIESELNLPHIAQ